MTAWLFRSTFPAGTATCATGACTHSARPPRSRSAARGAALFGYTKLYGQIPGGQAELLRVPYGNTLPIKVPDGPPDDRFVFLSDVLPTAWQAVEYAGIPPGGTVTVLGLGPIGAMTEKLMGRFGVDRLGALHAAIDIVRLGGTISVSGVYGGAVDPMPLLTVFDKQIQLRMGQANVRRWVDNLLPLLTDEDPLGVDAFATHHMSLEDGPKAYQMFQDKEDGMIKTLLKP